MALRPWLILALARTTASRPAGRRRASHHGLEGRRNIVPAFRPICANQLEAHSGRLAGVSISTQHEGDFIAFRELTEAGFFNCGNMNEDVSTTLR